MFTKEDYNSLPIDVVVNLINQLEEERDMYRDKWREVVKMYGATRNEINMQKHMRNFITAYQTEIHYQILNKRITMQ